jgi:hypothetical protein
VLDLDGPEAMAELERAREGRALLRGPMVKTARGFHFLVAPTGRNRAGVLAGIDIRGVGGYIVAPPSVHPSGYRYEWAPTPWRL